METTVAVLDDHLEVDTVSDASQENEDLPPKDIVQSSKLKLISDLEKSFQLIIPSPSGSVFLKGGPLGGMIGVDFTLTFWPICSFRCHKFILAARSKVFYDMFMENPLMTDFKIEVIDFKMNKAVPHNMLCQ